MSKETKTNPLDQGTLQMVAVSDLVPSPYNPRVTNEKSDAFHDLVESIRVNGVVVPVHVRRHPTKKGKLDLLAGERRRRAAVKVGAQKIPAVNHGDIGDALAFEICFIENYAREDLTPIEQGRAVDMLLTKYNGDTESVAERLGKSIRWVQRRKALGTRLSKAWSTGLVKNENLKDWTVAHLQLVASLPTEVQDRFYEEYKSDTTPSVKDLSKHVSSIMHLIRMAPFDVVAAGCQECPKRTSVTPGLFDDTLDKTTVRKDDRCLDYKCWTEKVLAWLEATYKEKLVDMPRLVPIATEPLYRDNKEYIIEKAPTFTNLLQKYEYESCSKTSKNAFPGFIVFGKAVGTILWCKAFGGTAEKKSKKKAPGTPTTLKVRRVMLESKRAAEFLSRVSAIVEFKLDPGDIVNTDDVIVLDLTLLALADTFGVLKKYNHAESDDYGKADTMAPWRQYKKSMRNPKQIRQSLWSNLLPVLCNSLIYKGPKSQTTPERVKSAKKLAGLFAIDTNAIIKQIKKDMPEPKSWANLNADGTPKAVAKPKKKTKKASTEKKSSKAAKKKTPKVRTCRVCGCTQAKPCIIDGVPCYWVKKDLCSACKKPKTKKAQAKKKSKVIVTQIGKRKGDTK